MTILIVLGVLFLAAIGSAALRNEKIIRRLAVAVAITIFVFVHVREGMPIDFQSLFVTIISFIFLMCTMVSYRYLEQEYQEQILSTDQIRVYYTCLHFFVLTMLGAVTTQSLGILWIALEGTTLATTLLVALYKQDASVEAAWKYLILCSMGISLGLFGVLLLAYAGISAGMSTNEALSLPALFANASELPAEIVRWAFVFIFVGLGTKVGFVPMHTWLPDAHGKTPSPISAMLSGVLLNVALYGILRMKTIVDIALQGSGWTNTFFLVFGVISVIVPALILLQQRSYKRMLAYSSVEHMGLTAIAIGLGPIGLIAATMHLIGHSIVKSALFFTTSEILLEYKSTKIENVQDLASRLPITASLFILGLLFILAMPLSPLFASEFLLFTLSIPAHLAIGLATLIALSVVMIGMMKSAMSMLYGTDENVHHEHVHKERFHLTHAVVILQLLLAVGLGTWFLTIPGLDFVTHIAESL